VSERDVREYFTDRRNVSLLDEKNAENEEFRPYDVCYHVDRANYFTRQSIITFISVTILFLIIFEI
jgi:hypothetical protein